MANKKKVTVTEEVTEDNTAGVRREQPPIDAWSAAQGNPFTADADEGRIVADDVATKAERTGSVLPYKTDEIDVDSLDIRTDADIQAQKEAEAADTKDAK